MNKKRIVFEHSVCDMCILDKQQCGLNSYSNFALGYFLFSCNFDVCKKVKFPKLINKWPNLKTIKIKNKQSNRHAVLGAHFLFLPTPKTTEIFFYKILSGMKLSRKKISQLVDTYLVLL